MTTRRLSHAREGERLHDNIEYLYHVTYAGRLPGIVDAGLAPDRARSIGSGGYDFHAKGRVFLTEAGGVFFWMSRAEDFATHRSDSVEEGDVPVVLRISADSLPEEPTRDPLGSQDALHDAWMVTVAIDARAIEIYDGDEWVELVDACDPPGEREYIDEDDLRELLQFDAGAALEEDEREEREPDEDDEDEDEDDWEDYDIEHPPRHFRDRSPFLPPELSPYLER